MKTSKEKQVRNSLTYLLPTVLGAALPLLTLPLFTRALSKEAFGAFALASAYGMFVSGIVNMGLTTAYERNYFEYRESPESRAQLLYGVLGCVLAVFSLSMMITWIFRHDLAVLIIGNGDYEDLIFWTACSVNVISFKQYYLLYFRCIEDASSYARFSIIEMILNALFSVVFIYGFESGVVGLALGPLLGSLVVFIALLLKLVEELHPSFSWPPVRNSLSLALPLTPLSLFKVIGAQSDKYLLGLLGGLGGVGLYSIGQRFGYSVFICMTALQNVFSPQIYHRMFTLPPDDAAKSIGKYITPFAYLCCGCALGVALFAQEAIILLTTPEFYDAYDVAIVLALFYVLSFLSKIPQLTYARKTHINTVLSLISNISNFVFCAAGIYLMGVIGAGLGLLFSGLVISPLVVFLGQRSYYIAWETKRLSVIFGYVFLAAFCVLFLRFIRVEYVFLFLMKVLISAGYLIIGSWIDLLSRDNIHASFRAVFCQNASSEPSK